MKAHFVVLLTFCSFLVDSLSAQVFPSFYGAKSPASTSSVPSDVRLCATSDINNDGNLDLIGWDANYVKILYLDGAGTFIGDTFYLINLNTVIDCDTADLNHDGYEDIVGLNNGSFAPTEGIFILMSDSNGRMTLTFVGDVNTQQASQITLGDFDNDGYTDAGVAGGITANVSVFYGNAAYTFDPVMQVNTGASASMYYITSADFNSDSLVDLAVSFDNLRYTVLLSDSVQGLFQITNYSTTGPVNEIISSDLNLDGNPELIFAYFGPSGSNGVQILPGLGNGAYPFSFATFYSNGGLNRSVAKISTPDLNNDGYPDIAMPNDNVAHIYLINNGTGTMTYSQRSGGGYYPLFADFNNDGYTDLISLSAPNFYCFANGDGTGILPLAPRSDGYLDHSVEAGDFNNDGFGDILSYNPSTGAQCLSTGASSCILTSTWTTNTPLGENITIADFNADGFKDYATYRRNVPRVKVFINNAGNGFLAPDSVPVTGSTTGESWISSGDLNNDGNVDIVYGYENSGNCYYGILLSNGAGGFQPPVVDTASTTLGFNLLEVALVNNDNIYDIVIHHDGTKISVLYGTSNASYAPIQTYNTTHAGALKVTVTHIDFDQYPDLCIHTTSGTDVMYGNSSGTFPTVTAYSGSTGTSRSVVCKDLNGDWYTDLAHMNYLNGFVYIRTGDGNRNFSGFDTMYLAGVSTMNSSGDLCAIDIDGDGLMDLVDNLLFVYRNTTPGIIITSTEPQTALASSIVSAYPNPATGSTNLKINSVLGTNANVRLIAINGQTIRDYALPIESGENLFAMDLEGIVSGVYVLEVLIGEERKCERLVVQ